MNRRRVGFVVEQALGHVAYGLGLRDALRDRTDLDCVFIDVPFPPGRFGQLPGVGTNWTLRGSFRAERAIASTRRSQRLDGLFIHTQTIGLFSGRHMAEVPTLLSLDATPLPGITFVLSLARSARVSTAVVRPPIHPLLSGSTMGKRPAVTTSPATSTLARRK